MSFLSLMPKTGTIFTVLLLAIAGFVVAPIAMAKTGSAPISISGSNDKATDSQYLQVNTLGQSHSCGDHGINKSCPDDADCEKICTSTCAAAVFLIPGFASSEPFSRITTFLPHTSRVVAYQHPLNAPPPRS